jgi:hypothetical protein
MGAQILMHLLTKASNKDRFSIGDNALAHKSELGILSNSVCSGYGYEVGRLSQAVHDDPYRVIPTRGVK